MKDFRLTNTLSRKKELFVPVHPGHVGMYVCGPTVYGDAHLGHARPGVTYDVLFKLLRHLGYKVRYVRNITDVGHLEHDADEGEDKIARKARLEQLEPMEVVQTYTLRYHEAMRLLNVAPPSIEPRASGHIIEQIEAVKKILDTGMLGRILFVKVNSFWYRGTNYYTLWWRGTWDKEGGGCTLNHAVHQIDILNYLMGKPLSITSVMANLAHDNAEIEDISLSLLRYPNALAEVNVTLCNHDERQEFEIVTEKATITVPWSVHAVKQLPNGFFEANPEMEKQLQDMYDSIPDLEMEGHPAEIGNVLKAIAGEEELLIDGKAGKDALDVIYGIYESAVERREVTLPIPADSPFYTKEGMLGKVPVYHEKSVSVDNIDGDITLGRN